MEIKKINEVVKNNLCIGCGMCTNFSDTARIDYSEDGFLVVKNYKHTSKEISEEELTRKICPGINTYSVECEKDAVWGNIKSLNLGYSTDEKIRFMGSSGGTITQTLIYLLENKIVDYVIHIEQDEEDPFGNKVVITDDIDKILANTGSKYCPASPIENIFKNIDFSKKYAFVGRPCDIVSLENYARLNKKVNEAILYKISFFCAGTPSLKGTDKILEKFGLEEEDVKSFRYRGNGWPGFTTAVDKDNKAHTMPYNDSWGKILNKYLNNRCKVCPDGVGIASDIVYGDGWDCDENGYPIFSEGEGKSIIVTRTEKGKELLDKMNNDNKIAVEKFDYKNLKFVQPYQYNRRTSMIYRTSAMKLFGRKLPIYEKAIKAASKEQGSKAKIKTFLGTVKRVIKKRL